jgi:DNA (cytosine-5)-methyltransferase 1
VAEAARLQGFADDVQFVGSRASCYRQIGNAVPPRLARAVAREVVAMLDAHA